MFWTQTAQHVILPDELYTRPTGLPKGVWSRRLTNEMKSMNDVDSWTQAGVFLSVVSTPLFETPFLAVIPPPLCKEL